MSAQKKEKILFTPRDVRVSPKHVLSIFNEGNGVIFAITIAVESVASPTVSRGAVAKQPLRIISNSWSKELMKTTLIKGIVIIVEFLKKPGNKAIFNGIEIS